MGSRFHFTFSVSTLFWSVLIRNYIHTTHCDFYILYQYWTSRPRSPLQLFLNKIVFVYGFFFLENLNICITILFDHICFFVLNQISVFNNKQTASNAERLLFFRMGLLNHAKEFFEYLRAKSCRQDFPNPNRWPIDPSIPVDMRKFLLQNHKTR